eukprot:4853283-Pyramimonas_sp.AAC.1
MLPMIYRMSALLILVFNHNMYEERQFDNLKEHVRTELHCQADSSEYVTVIVEAIQSAGNIKG